MPSDRVLLVFPPTRVGEEQILACMPPMGAMSMAAVLRDDHEIKILDATAEGFSRIEKSGEGFVRRGLATDEIARRVVDFHPDIVGITCLFSTLYPVVEEICRAVKSVSPRTVTIVGGTHPTFLARSSLASCREIDFIVLGEGEDVGRRLLTALSRGEGLGEIDGLAYREDGEIRIQPKTTFIEDLDSLPWPARDLVPMDVYTTQNRVHGVFSNRGRATSITTSRGCPAQCTFCSSMHFWGNRWRGRSAENVVAEIEHVVERYGIEEIQFEDDNLTLNRARAKRIFELMIARDLGVSWSTPNGIALWAMDEEMIRLMKASGCYEVTLAFETGNQGVMDRIVKKPLDLKKAAEITRLVKKHGLDQNAFFIMGFPGETKEEMRDTYRLARRLKLQSAWFFVANPLPGSELYERTRRDGTLVPEFDPVNIAYTRSSFRTPEWSGEDVERLAHRSLVKIQLLGFLFHPLHHLRRYFRRPAWTIELAGLVWRRLLRMSELKRRARQRGKESGNGVAARGNGSGVEGGREAPLGENVVSARQARRFGPRLAPADESGGKDGRERAGEPPGRGPAEAPGLGRACE